MRKYRIMNIMLTMQKTVEIPAFSKSFTKMHTIEDCVEEPRNWRDFFGIFKTDGHDVERFLSECSADKIHEIEIENREAAL